MVSAAFCVGQGALAANAPPAPEPTKTIDPRLYSGRWYEIARLPNKIQQNCQLPDLGLVEKLDGGYSLVQTRRVGSPSGPTKTWRAGAKIDHATRNAKVRGRVLRRPTFTRTIGSSIAATTTAGAS